MNTPREFAQIVESADLLAHVLATEESSWTPSEATRLELNKIRALEAIALELHLIRYLLVDPDGSEPGIKIQIQSS